MNTRTARTNVGASKRPTIVLLAERKDVLPFAIVPSWLRVHVDGDSPGLPPEFEVGGAPTPQWVVNWVKERTA